MIQFTVWYVPTQRINPLTGAYLSMKLMYIQFKECEAIFFKYFIIR